MRCQALEPDAGEVPCRSEAEACEQVRSNDRAYDFTLELATSDDGGAAFTEEKLAERMECLVSWLEKQGLDAEVDSDGERVTLTAEFEAVEGVLNSGVLNHYTVDCASGDCQYCEEFGAQECGADAFCRNYVGRRYNETWICLGSQEFAGCVAHNLQCGQAPSFARDETGQCWWFSTYCYDLRRLPIDPSCGDADSDPAPDCPE